MSCCERSGRVRPAFLLFLVGSLFLGLASVVWADAPLFLPAKPGPVGPPADDAENDPPGVLDDLDSAHIVDLAARLSEDPRWLSESLRGFDQGSLRLHELFAEAPEFFTKNGSSFFRIEIERIGPHWEDFDPRIDPFAVFLTHETYTGLGRDRVLALVDGQQTVLFEHDLNAFHLFALSIQGHPSDRPVAKSASVASLEEPVALGLPRLAAKRFDQEVVGGFPIVPTKAGCAHEVAPTSCSGMRPVCAAGASPHFILSRLKIRTDHEGAFKGNPEIELFPLNIEAASTGSTSNRSTPFIFSGRTISDSAGRSRFLPDVNNTNVWYTIGQGVAICPATLGNEWATTLVEQDDATGVLKLKGDKINKVKIFRRAAQSAIALYRMDFLKFAQNFVRLLIGLFSGDGDDLYQESIGLTGDLFCNDGLGRPFPRVFNLASAEWDLQGYFACVNPSCTPMTASISGPSSLFGLFPGTYSVNVGSGVTPFAYRWTKNGALVGTGTTVSVSNATSFTLAVAVTDASGQTATASKFVHVDDGMCGDVFC